MVRSGSTRAVYALFMLHSTPNFLINPGLHHPGTVDTVHLSPTTGWSPPEQPQVPAPELAQSFGEDRVHLSMRAQSLTPNQTLPQHHTRQQVRSRLGSGALASLANSYFEQQQMAQNEGYGENHFSGLA